MNTCTFPGCKSPAPNGVYCVLHQRVYGRKEPPKTQEPIAKFSEKRKAQSAEYKKFVKDYLARPENKICNIQIENVCTHIATTINHRKRRYKDTLMNEEFIEPCCSACNTHIEQHDGEARDTGHLLSKYK